MASLLSRIGGQIRAALTRTGLQRYDRSLYPFLNPGMPVAQVPVTEQGALTISAVFAAVRNISEDIAGLDLNLFQIGKDGSKTIAREHSLAYILDRKPNRETTSRDFIQAIIACGLLYGNGYAEIERDSSTNRPIALWLIDPRDMQLQRDGLGILHYVWQGSVRLELDNVIHVKGFTLNGIIGEMTVRLGKEALSLSKAYEHFAAATFGNGIRPGGVFKYPLGTTLTEGAKNKLYEEQREIHGRAENSSKNMVLPAGWEYEPFQINYEQNQFLEGRTFALDEVSRWFRCPPSKLANLAKISYSSLEYQSMEYVNDTLRPWMVKLQHEFENKLLTRPEQMVYDICFDPSELLRAGAKERAEANQVLFQNGALTLDEWRAKEGMNPLPDGTGKVHFTNVNIVTVEKVIRAGKEPVSEPGAPPVDAPEPAKLPAPDPSVVTRGMLQAIRPSLIEEVSRLLRVESDKAIRSAKQNTLPKHIEEFYPKHAEHIRSALGRVLSVADAALVTIGGKLDASSAIDATASRMVEASKSDLSDPEGLQQRVENWNERAEMVVDDLVASLKEQLGL